MGARRLGQDEQYLTVREILSEVSTLADGALSREHRDFYRFGYATLGFTLDNVENEEIAQSETGNPPEGWESEGQIINHTQTCPEDQVC